MNNKVWVTKSDGIVRKVDDYFTNKNFVEKIHNDSSSMSRYMNSLYPTPVTIKLMNDTIPKSWIQWEEEEINIKEIEKNIVLPQEYSGEKRLTISKSEVSERTHHCMRNSNMSVTPRGIKDKGVPLTPTLTFSSIINTIYLIVDKYTTASVRRKENIEIPLDKKMKYKKTVDIVNNRDNILQVLLISAYIEPSSTMLNRAYLLADIYGLTTVNLIINDIYYRVCRKQVNNLLELWEIKK